MPGDGGGEGPQLQGLAGDQSSSVTTQTHAASQHRRVVPEGCLYHFSFMRADFLVSCFLVASCPRYGKWHLGFYFTSRAQGLEGWKIREPEAS